MAIVTQIINGYLADSSGDPLSSGFVRFSLSRYDTSSNGVISSYKDIDAPIQTDGSILQELWPNSRGNDGTHYHVLLLDDKRKIKESLGIIRVEEAGPYELSDLIEAQSTGGEPTLYRVMTKAEYDAVIAAASTATSAALAAESARDDAQAIAYGPDPVFNTAKVTNNLTVDGLVKGTAVQSSAADATADRLLKVGAFGLGANAIGIDSGTDLNNITDSGLYSWNSSSIPTNAPGSFFSTMLHIQRDASYATQLVVRIGSDGLSGKIYTRSANAGGWNQWNQPYDTRNILGTVSQSGGVPTGGIIESGSGANGYYTRWASGHQECWMPTFATAASAAATWTFPAAFISGTIVAGAEPLTAANLNVVPTSAPGTTSVNFRSFDADSGDESVLPTALVWARGRWF